jgi:acetyl esterase/lipase
MKEFKLFFTLCLALTINYASAQLCDQDNRFSDAEFFSITRIDSLTSIKYGAAINHQGESQDLLIDFYFPNNSIDTMSERPFILLVHGGGFTGGSKEGHTTSMCKEFAKRGFVAATMSYRLGFDQAVPRGIALAIYRAQQDANAALRYTVKNAVNLKIDTSWIFMGGSSAGAVTSLYTTYGSQEEWNEVLPALESKLGPLDSSGNNLEQTFTIKAIFNNYGAVTPKFFSPAEELIPMISFHGELDKRVPIDKSPETGYGSRSLHNMLNEQGVCNDFTIDPIGGHGVYYSEEGVKFSVGRAACFFKSLFCDTCSNFFSTETISANCSN